MMCTSWRFIIQPVRSCSDKCPDLFGQMSRLVGQPFVCFVSLAERSPKDCRKEVLDTLRLIVNNPSIKHKEIAERLAVSERTAGTYVAELKRYCIKRVGGNTFGHWEAK